MPIHRYFLNDFVEIQRRSFYDLLEKGLIDEINKRNPITNASNDLEVYFYPEYYKLTVPSYTPRQAILLSKSYISKLYIPVQFTDKKEKITKLKWVYIGNLPLMTKRGHFILNGAARVIVNQIIRSPGIYYQQKNYSANISTQKKVSSKIIHNSNIINNYNRYYADLICQRGAWLRLEIDKEKNIWAQLKKGPKIPVFWLLIAMGIPEKSIFNFITESHRLVSNLGSLDVVDNQASRLRETPSEKGTKKKAKKSVSKAEEKAETQTFSEEKETLHYALRLAKNYVYVKNPPEAWQAIFSLNFSGKKANSLSSAEETFPSEKRPVDSEETNSDMQESSILFRKKNSSLSSPTLRYKNGLASADGPLTKNMDLVNSGRRWIYNKFMNPRTYDLGKQGRLAFNKKLGLSISPNQVTLTPLDLLYATDYLIRVEKGKEKIDDIDHLKNRRVRTSGELIQIQIGVGFVRLEKSIRDAMNKRELNKKNALDLALASLNKVSSNSFNKKEFKKNQKKDLLIYSRNNKLNPSVKDLFYLSSLINTKSFNSAIREFFGTSPLSQFMDQINPLAEITHKRRLSSMGPGGVTRDSATLDIRGIHPTHYGRICPIETPEGKNTGLVSSLTAYARVNANGIIESPFYRVYKGQVQKTSNKNFYYFSAEQEEKMKLAAPDISVSSIGFLPYSTIPVRISEDLTFISRNQVQYMGVSPLQMISIATSLIPFLEHDDANRALMGSNMQRQAVPLIRPERPIVGTGLEGRAISDSGHILQSRYSGFVSYVSGNKIVITTYI